MAPQIFYFRQGRRRNLAARNVYPPLHKRVQVSLDDVLFWSTFETCFALIVVLSKDLDKALNGVIIKGICYGHGSNYALAGVEQV